MKETEIITELDALRFLLIKKYKNDYPSITNNPNRTTSNAIFKKIYYDVDRKLGVMKSEIDRNPKKYRDKYIHHCDKFQNYLLYDERGRIPIDSQGRELLKKDKLTKKLRRPTKSETREDCTPDKESFRRFIRGEVRKSIGNHAKESYLLHLELTRSDLAKLVEENKVKQANANCNPSEEKFEENESKLKSNQEDEIKNDNSPKRKIKWSIVIQSAAALFTICSIIFGIYIILSENKGQPKLKKNVVYGKHRPSQVFSSDTTSFKLLVLPFDNNDSDELTGVEVQFLERFNEIILSDSLNIEVKYIADRSITPTDFDEAEKKVEEYRADLAIWGDLFKNKNCKNDEICVKYSLSEDVYNAQKEINPEIDKSTTETRFFEYSSKIASGYLQEEIDEIIYWSISKSLFKHKEYQKVINYLLPLIEKKSSNPKLNKDLAWAYFKLSDLPNAVKYNVNAIMSLYGIPIKNNADILDFFSIKKKPLNKNISNNVANLIYRIYNLYDIYDFSRDDTGGITDIKVLKKMVELLPEMGFSWSLLLKELNKQKDKEVILYYSLQCINHNNNLDLPFLYFEIGDMLMEIGEIDLAFLSYCMSGSINYRLYDKVILNKINIEKIYDMADSYNLNKDIGWRAIGNALNINKNLKLAEKSYKKAVEITNFDDERSLEELANFLFDRNRKLEAAKYYVQRAKLSPTEDYLWEKPLQIYDELSMRDEAKSLYETAIDLGCEEFYFEYGKYLKSNFKSEHINTKEIFLKALDYEFNKLSENDYLTLYDLPNSTLKIIDEANSEDKSKLVDHLYNNLCKVYEAYFQIWWEIAINIKDLDYPNSKNQSLSFYYMAIEKYLSNGDYKIGQINSSIINTISEESSSGKELLEVLVYNMNNIDIECGKCWVQIGNIYHNRLPRKAYQSYLKAIDLFTYDKSFFDNLKIPEIQSKHLYRRIHSLINDSDKIELAYYYEFIKESKPDIWYSIGESFQKIGYNEYAIKWFKQVFKEEPKHHLVNSSLGDIYFKLGDYKKSVKHFEKQVTLDKYDDSIEMTRLFHLRDLAISYVKNNEYDKAINIFEEMEVVDSYYVSYYYYGFAFEKQNKLDNALSKYDKSYECASYYRSAVLQEKKGNLVDAEKNFRKFIFFTPINLKTEYFFNRNDSINVLSAINSLISINSSLYMDLKSKYYLGRGNPKQAEKYMSIYLNQNQYSGKIDHENYLIKGHIQYILDNKESALDFYKKYIDKEYIYSDNDVDFFLKNIFSLFYKLDIEEKPLNELLWESDYEKYLKKNKVDNEDYNMFKKKIIAYIKTKYKITQETIKQL